MEVLKNLGREIQAELTPERYLGEEDIQLFRQAGVQTPAEIKWAAQVKLLSAQKKDYRPTNLYGLVRLHAMMLKDLKSSPEGELRPATERFLDQFVKVAEEYFKKVHHFHERTEEQVQQTLKSDREHARYYGEAWNIYKDLMRASTGREKAAVVSRLLNLFHTGRNPEGLHWFGVGYPTPGPLTDPGSSSMLDVMVVNPARDFLRDLNHLGNEEYWEKPRKKR